MSQSPNRMELGNVDTQLQNILNPYLDKCGNREHCPCVEVSFAIGCRHFLTTISTKHVPTLYSTSPWFIVREQTIKFCVQISMFQSDSFGFHRMYCIVLYCILVDSMFQVHVSIPRYQSRDHVVLQMSCFKHHVTSLEFMFILQDIVCFQGFKCSYVR